MYMQWLVLILALECGWQPNAYFESYSPPSRVIGNSQLYQQFEAKAIGFGFLEVGGKIRVQDWLTDGGIGVLPFGFWPSQLESTFFADVKIGPATIGWRHGCVHPIVPFQPTLGYKPAWDGSYDEVYARVELKLAVQ